MDAKLTMKILERLGNAVDDIANSLPEETPLEDASWDFISIANKISEEEGVQCLINVNFFNGGVAQAFCLITDFEPYGGAIALRSNEGEFPTLHIIYPEEFADFMSKTQCVFDKDYPEIILNLSDGLEDEED